MKKIFVLLMVSVIGPMSGGMDARAVCEESLRLPMAAFVATGDKAVLTNADVEAVREKASAVSPETRQKFGKALVAWRQAIESNVKARISSSTRSYAELPEFEALKGMGGEIIPLIMEKLLEKDSFYLLPLYEAVQADKKLVPAKVGSEQERAVQAVRLWLDAGRA